ncbi:2,5-didehydrogluconate reductase [Anaeromyces robustus]|uniref:2,5-didehydrogluconate reductase n=1 Tax=Anaeromyces robustus TaxID=1754192 RepID=A0A1Y1XLP5_9FUNG|nr:2,5-didehydrogluconate reductase [Anaeromyces robustus]|eukprot:ORX86274.1 2,5-didehydrogluconate reductase [Anaeromyces robustus]
MTQQTYVTLNNGVKIPQFGLGVFLVDGDNNTEDAVIEALKLGYRHIDTAHAYFNERGVGEAIKKSGIPREEIFVTSKLWPTEYGEGLTYKAVEKMLKRLQLDYIDMVLLHHPMRDFIGGWKDLEKLNADGKVKAIGISNFDKDFNKLDELLKVAKVMPAVCQSECHPYQTQQKLRNALGKYNTLIEAYYPIGHGDKNLINEPIFTKLAQKYNKTNVQIILRWHIQYGNIVIPKSSNPVHIKENFEIFDFELSPEEMEEIKKLDTAKYYFLVPFAEYEKIIDGYNENVAKYD